MRGSPTSATRSIRSTASATRSVLAFRDYHAGLIANLLGNSAEAQRRLKSAHDSDKSSLRFADAYARVLDAQGDVAGATKIYQDFSVVIPHHPLIERALADLKANDLCSRWFMTRRRRRGGALWPGQCREPPRGRTSGARLSAIVALPSTVERSDRGDAGQSFRAAEARRPSHCRLPDGAGVVAAEVGRRHPDRARTR